MLHYIMGFLKDPYLDLYVLTIYSSSIANIAQKYAYVHA